MAEAAKSEFRASAKRVRMSAQKARLVMDTVRGMHVDEATVMLSFMNKRAAPIVRKLIESAVANAEDHANRGGFDIDSADLVIAEARVDEGMRAKRFRPRSRGMAHPYVRRSCHFHVIVAEQEYVEKKANERPAWRKPRKRMSQEARLKKVGRAPAKVPEKAEKKKDEEKPAVKANAETGTKPAGKKTTKKTAEKKPAEKKTTQGPVAEKKTEVKSKKKSETGSEKKPENKSEEKA